MATFVHGLQSVCSNRMNGLDHTNHRKLSKTDSYLGYEFEASGFSKQEKTTASKFEASGRVRVVWAFVCWVFMFKRNGSFKGDSFCTFWNSCFDVGIRGEISSDQALAEQESYGF
jgi:hypothetical protein